MSDQNTGLTFLGKAFVFLLVVGLLGGGAYVAFQKMQEQKAARSGGAAATKASTGAGGGGGAATTGGGSAAGAAHDSKDEDAASLVDTRTEVPALSPAAPYTMPADGPNAGVVAIELSEYAGYAGLIAANGGLEPSADSVFAKKHGFKVKLTLSEEESWSALNAGRMAASATTADVLAVYGRQFKVVVPAQIGFSRGADGIVVRSDVKRINGLAGKRIVASQFTEADFFLRYLAQEAGIPVKLGSGLDSPPDPKSIQLVYGADAFAAGDLFLEEVKAGRDRLAGCVTWDPKTTEVAEGSGGKAHVLTTNKNLLIVADILIVNRGFAEANPKVVAGLVDGLLEGNRRVRENPEANLDLVGKAFKWDRDQTRRELAKVHLANLPENLAFFSGAIDSAGSFGGIYQSAVLAYGKDLVKDPPDAERFVDLAHLKALEAGGSYAGQKVELAPIASSSSGPLEGDPLLTRDIRFYFSANSANLDMANQSNTDNLGAIKKLLQVSPGSTILLRGHVDNALIEQFRKQGGETFVRQMALKATELSKNRAAEVKRVLVEKHAVDKARIETVGRGWEEPVSSVSEENRRVEVQWFTVE